MIFRGSAQIEGILPKGPYLPCVSMAGGALLAGYHRNVNPWFNAKETPMCLQWSYVSFALNHRLGLIIKHGHLIVAKMHSFRLLLCIVNYVWCWTVCSYISIWNTICWINTEVNWSLSLFANNSLKSNVTVFQRVIINYDWFLKRLIEIVTARLFLI